MGQNFAAAIAAVPGGGVGYASLDAEGNLLVSSGDKSSALNVSAAAVIKAAPGRLAKIIVVAVPSAGSLVVNDLTTTTGSAAANIIASIPFGSLVAGQVISLDWPCLVGIAITSVGTAGVYSVSFT